MKCRYCGGMFIVPPSIGRGAYLCANHSDRMATGLCNDCGDNFCGECLHSYDLKTQNVRATLYLCPSCLREKYIDKANDITHAGILIAGCGVFMAIFSLSLGIFCAILGMGVIFYGVSERAASFSEPTVNELCEEREKRKAEIAASEGGNIEWLYNELVSQYVNHWGAQRGTELLESEVMAHLRHGESFQEAVQKIYWRQQRKKEEKMA